VPVNLVSVTIAASDSPADAGSPEGYFVFAPSGVMWPDASNLPIVPMVVHGVLVNGTATVSLVASDSFGAGVLTWDVIINIRGLPTINVAGVPVNFASGATQSIWSILSAAGWSPTPQP
jgi:hypothetical protein